MADTTINMRFQEWRTSRARSEKQITDALGVIWMKEWYNELKKKLISIGRNNLFSDQIGLAIHANQSTYTLPMWTTDTRPTGWFKDFVSVIQIEVGYEKDPHTNLPKYHVCEQVKAEEYSDEKRKETPEDKPKYEFLWKDEIVIFPTPKHNLANGIKIRYNYWEEEITWSTKEKDLQLPFYLIDTLDMYLDYRLKWHETTREQAQIEYDLWGKEIEMALWMINNRDSRAVKETFLDLRSLC